MNVVAALVRLWTAIYTWGLPDGERQARCDEIESDLWECRHGEPAMRSTPLTVLGRLLRGVPDDLGWRRERASAFSLALAGGAVLFAIAALSLIVWAGSAQTLPQPMPLEGRVGFDRTPGPPPPPPPPPCPPAASGYAAPPGCARVP
jgi:hypothetical protein